MFGLSLSEIIFLAILALVVIGPKQLPEVARTIGRFLNELRRTTSVLTEDLKSHVRIDALDLNQPPARKTATKEPAAAPPPQEQQLKFDLQTPEIHEEKSLNEKGQT